MKNQFIYKHIFYNILYSTAYTTIALNLCVMGSSNSNGFIWVSTTKQSLSRKNPKQNDQKTHKQNPKQYYS